MKIVVGLYMRAGRGMVADADNKGTENAVPAPALCLGHAHRLSILNSITQKTHQYGR